jgi:hypothetical protein
MKRKNEITLEDLLDENEQDEIIKSLKQEVIWLIFPYYSCIISNYLSG